MVQLVWIRVFFRRRKSAGMSIRIPFPTPCQHLDREISFYHQISELVVAEDVWDLGLHPSLQKPQSKSPTKHPVRRTTNTIMCSILIESNASYRGHLTQARETTDPIRLQHLRRSTPAQPHLHGQPPNPNFGMPPSLHKAWNCLMLNQGMSLDLV